MWKDEERHEALFSLISQSLDSQDRLRPDADRAHIIESIRRLGELFLPRHLRSGAMQLNPLGQGGNVWSLEANADAHKNEQLLNLLQQSELKERVLEHVHSASKPIEEFSVFIKTTFMLGYDQKDLSVIIDTELLHTLIRFLKSLGIQRVQVGDGRNIYDEFYEHRSVAEVARYYGLNKADQDFELIDLTEEQAAHHYPFGMAQNTIAPSWRDADFRLVFGKLRTHPTDFSHLCVATLQGVGARLEAFLFAERQAHRDTALLMPLAEFPPHFALLEGYDHAADGLVGMLGCRNPPQPRRLYAGADALSVDIVATRHMGLPNPLQIEIFDEACRWFGDPTSAIQVKGEDTPLKRWRTPFQSPFSRLLSMISYPVYVLLSGRGAAFVPRMDPQAFPIKGKESLRLRLQRWFVRALIGLP